MLFLFGRFERMAPKKIRKKPAGAEADPVRRLSMVLNTWVAREVPGAKDLKTKADALGSRAERLAFLTANVLPNPTPGRRANAGDSFDPSEGNQIENIEMVNFSRTCVKKTYKSNSAACKRTLAVYAMLRRKNLEAEAPVARLLQVDNEGIQTHMFFEYLRSKQNQFF